MPYIALVCMEGPFASSKHRYKKVIPRVTNMVEAHEVASKWYGKLLAGVEYQSEEPEKPRLQTKWPHRRR